MEILRSRIPRVTKVEDAPHYRKLEPLPGSELNLIAEFIRHEFDYLVTETWDFDLEGLAMWAKYDGLVEAGSPEGLFGLTNRQEVIRALAVVATLVAFESVAVMPAYHVGASILALNSEGKVIFGNGYRGEKKYQWHAEHHVIEKFIKEGISLEKAILAVNMEPCNHRTCNIAPCAQQIIESQIKTVVINVIDPHNRVNGNGLDVLGKAGVEILHVPELAPMTFSANRHLPHFQHKMREMLQNNPI